MVDYTTLPTFWAWLQATQQIRTEMNGTGRIALLGDSITYYMTPMWSGLGSKNSSFDRLAYPGAQLQDLIDCTQPLLAASLPVTYPGQASPSPLPTTQPLISATAPSCAIVMIGTNNVLAVPNNEPPNTLYGLGVLIPNLRTVLPNSMRIALCTLPPMDKNKYPNAVNLLSYIQGTNGVIKQAAANEQGLPVLDVYAALAGPDGFSLPGDTIADGIHPSAQGYAKIKPLYDAQITAWAA